MTLRMQATIAGAVARSILRTEQDPSYLQAETIAYKAALIERGADCELVCGDAARDYSVMVNCMRSAE